jgi:hypothetical protein
MVDKVISVEHIKHGLAYVQFDCYTDGSKAGEAAHYAIGHRKPNYPMPAVIYSVDKHANGIGIYEEVNVLCWRLVWGKGC